jgi:polyhydroxyalkanoate synthesis repressor PhaR
MASSRPSAPVITPPDRHAAPAIIKKYANRRLYNTESSSYITLEHLAQLVRDGREFVVQDARTGEDITRQVLTQIIMEQEQDGAALLPVSFLRELIGLYGNSMQSLVPHYLEASMEAMKRNQEQVREAMAGAFAGTPFEALARQNMAMFAKAAEMWAPPRRTSTLASATPETTRTDADEAAALRATLADLQARLDALDKR